MGDYQHCEIRGHKLAFRRQGAGEPVLLVHGITTYSFIWESVAARLAEDHDVIAVDLFGCGHSAKPLELSYALRDHASYLVELLDALQLERVHFVGHDLGGGIGQIVAVRNPERLHDLALLNCVGYDYWPVQPITTLRTPVIRQFLMATLDLFSLKALVRRGLFHKELLTPDLLELFAAPLHTSEGRKGLLHFARCLENADLTGIAPQLPEVKLPVLLLWGEADVYLRRTIVERLHADLPRSVLQWIPDAGHYCPLDAPETISEHLLQLMRSSQDVPHDRP